MANLESSWERSLSMCSISLRLTGIISRLLSSFIFETGPEGYSLQLFITLYCTATDYNTLLYCGYIVASFDLVYEITVDVWEVQ